MRLGRKDDERDRRNVVSLKEGAVRRGRSGGGGREERGEGYSRIFDANV